MYFQRISAEDADGFFWMANNELPAEIKDINTLELDITNEYNVCSYVLIGPFEATDNSNLIFTVAGKNKGEDGWQMIKFFKKPGTEQIAPYFIIRDTILNNNGRLTNEEWRVWNDGAGLLRILVSISITDEDKISIWNQIGIDENNNNSNNSNNNRNINEDPSVPESNINVTTNNPSGGRHKVRKSRLRKTKRIRKTKAKHTHKRK